MLARQLRIKVPAVAPAVPSRIADWCAHSFPLGDETWLVFCNTAALYPVFALSTGVTDDESLMRRLGGMVEQVLKTNKLTHQATIFSQELREIQWAPVPDRTVLGSISEMINLAYPWFDEPGLTPAVLSENLGRPPMSALGMNNPTRAFGSLQS